MGIATAVLTLSPRPLERVSVFPALTTGDVGGSKGIVDKFQVTCRGCRIELQLQEVVLSVKQFKDKENTKRSPPSDFLKLKSEFR